MINETLPMSSLVNVFPREDPTHKGLDLESLDKILDYLQPTKSIRIADDRKLLGILHHALNIENYSKKDFRRLLLENAKDFELLQFFKSIGICENLPVDEKTKSEMIERAASIKWEDNPETRAFVEIFGYDSSIIPQKLEHDESSEILQLVGKPFKQLKDYQSEIFFAAMERVENDMNSRFMIQMPTGSGKTRIGVEIATTFLNTKEGRNVVWLSDRQELCIQAVENFKDVWKHVGNMDVKLCRFWGNYDVPDKTMGSTFLVASLAKAMNHLRKSGTLIKADLIVFDEAHHMAAPQYYNCVKHLSGLSTRIIGLSATPGRGYLHSKENFELAKIFWDNIVTIKSDSEGPITYLQRKRILAIAEKIKIEFYDPSFHISSEEWKQIVAGSEFPESIIKKLATNYIRNLRIAEKLKQLGEERKQVLFFAASVEQSRWLFAVARYFGFKAAHIESSTPSTYRMDIVDKFKRREINFIFNYDIFTTGFDAPNIDVIFIARPTKSHITFLQMIGRGMRGPLMGGTDKFDVIYIEDKIFEDANLDNLYESFGDYFGDYS